MTCGSHEKIIGYRRAVPIGLLRKSKRGPPAQQVASIDVAFPPFTKRFQLLSRCISSCLPSHRSYTTHRSNKPKAKERSESSYDEQPPRIVPSKAVNEAENSDSEFIVVHGAVEFYHYDFYSQALSKILRGHPKDLDDVRAYAHLRKIELPRLKELFHSIEAAMIRYPAIRPDVFKAKLNSFIQELT